MRAVRSSISVLALVALTVGLAGPARAQVATSSTPSAQPAEQDKPPLKQEELDQIVAPIALYPDDVVSQILMASTYPLEVVEAERWVKNNPQLKGDALAQALEAQSWDPSVKSLVNFPQVLTMLSEQLSSTVKLGDAFLGQQKQVMDTIQALRKKAMDQGTLKSSDELKVTQGSEGGTTTIVIQAADPNVVYVPVYDPTVVYGSWPYPAYPPYYYYPPGYPAHSGWSFAAGVTIGVAWGYAWGSCNWGGGDIDVDIDKNVDINHKIDRGKYEGKLGSGKGKGTWQHDSSHRQGVAYRDGKTAQRFGGGSGQAAQARESFRGRTAYGSSSSGGLGSGSPGDRGAPDRGGTDRGSLDRSGDRGSLGDGSRADRGGALSGVDRGGASARASSARGSSSRATMSGGRGGGARGGGGRRGR